MKKINCMVIWASHCGQMKIISYTTAIFLSNNLGTLRQDFCLQKSYSMHTECMPVKMIMFIVYFIIFVTNINSTFININVHINVQWFNQCWFVMNEAIINGIQLKKPIKFIFFSSTILQPFGSSKEELTHQPLGKAPFIFSAIYLIQLHYCSKHIITENTLWYPLGFYW